MFHDWNTLNISVMLSTLKICFPYGIYDILLAILLCSIKLGLYLRKSKCIHTFFISCSGILKNVSEKTLKPRCSTHIVNTYKNSASFYTKSMFNSWPLSHLTRLFYFSYTEIYILNTPVLFTHHLFFSF